MILICDTNNSILHVLLYVYGLCLQIAAIVFVTV